MDLNVHADLDQYQQYLTHDIAFVNFSQVMSCDTSDMYHINILVFFLAA
jgi:hypothetical protein